MHTWHALDVSRCPDNVRLCHILALNTLSCELVWLRTVLSSVIGHVSVPSPIHMDNSACINCLNDQVSLAEGCVRVTKTCWRHNQMEMSNDILGVLTYACDTLPTTRMPKLSARACLSIVHFLFSLCVLFPPSCTSPGYREARTCISLSLFLFPIMLSTHYWRDSIQNWEVRIFIFCGW